MVCFAVLVFRSKFRYCNNYLPTYQQAACMNYEQNMTTTTLSASYYFGSSWFQDSLLRTRRSGGLAAADDFGNGNGLRSAQTRRPTLSPCLVNKCRFLLLFVAFFNVGLWLGIVGPTIPDLLAKSNGTTFSATVGIISGNAFGAVLGNAIGGGIYAYVNALCMIFISLLAGGMLTIAVPWSQQFSGIVMPFIIQGLCLGFIERGAIDVFLSLYRRKRSFLHVLYIMLALGGVISCLTAVPFVFRGFNSSLEDSGTTSAIQTTIPAMMRIAKRSLNANATLNSTSVDELSSFNASSVNSSFTSAVWNVSLTTTTVRPHKPEVAAHTGGDEPTKTEIKKMEKAKIEVAKQKEEAAKKSTTTTPLVNSTFATTTAPILANTTSNLSTISPTPAGPLQLVNLNSGVTAASTTQLPPVTSTVQVTTVVSTTSTAAATTLTTSPSTTPTTPQSSTLTTTTVATSASTAPSDSTSKPTISQTTLAPSATTSTSTLPPGAWSTSELTLENLLQKAKDLNRAQFAYLLIGLVSIATAFGYLTLCLMAPCNALRTLLPSKSSSTPTAASDGHQAMDGLRASLNGATASHASERTATASLAVSGPYHCYAVTAAAFYFMLIHGLHSAVYSLLTVYSLTLAGGKSDQSTGPQLSMVYWAAATFGRVLTLIVYHRVAVRTLLVVQNVLIVLSSSVLLVFASYDETTEDPSWMLFWFCACAHGLGIGALFPWTFCWLDQTFNLSATIISLLLCSQHLGRMIVPVATASAMSDGVNSRALLVCMTIGSVMIALLSFALFKFVNAAERLRSLNFADSVRYANGSTSFHSSSLISSSGSRHKNQNGGANRKGRRNVEPLLDDNITADVPLDDLEETVHFDRQRDVAGNEDATYAQYFSSKRS